MPRGGIRPGAGRPRKAVKYERPINKAERQIVDRLPDLLDNLLALADGGYERVEERYEPAGTVLIDQELRNPDGQVALDAQGKPVRGKVQAFPHLAPDQLVLVQRTVSRADKDRAANVYLVDRIMGKPTEHQEIEHHGEVASGSSLTDEELSRIREALTGRARRG